MNMVSHLIAVVDPNLAASARKARSSWIINILGCIVRRNYGAMSRANDTTAKAEAECRECIRG